MLHPLSTLDLAPAARGKCPRPHAHGVTQPPSRALAPSSSSIPLAGLLQRLPRIAPGASQPSTKAALAPRTPSPLPRGVHTGSNIRAGSHKQPSLSKTA